MRRVVLGFSGGGDSAVAAKRLLDAGDDVTGLFLDVGVAGAREDALRTAERLRLPLNVLDARSALDERVCGPFLRGYLEGRTLNPCLLCNPALKLKALIEHADAIGAPFIATGHYAVARDGALYTGHPSNDQSYQLCRITNAQLDRLLLPLGGDEKPLVRAEAEAAGIPIAHKPDSMDICFIPDHDYAAWIERRVPAPAPGDALYRGAVFGRHNGIHRYTVGQRWSEDCNGRRLYVSAIRPEKNEIELCLWEELFRSEIDASDMNWLAPIPDAPFRARVRVRHTRWEMPECTVALTATGAHITADSPFRAPAKGQTAALYAGDRVIGAGEIV